MNRSRPLTPFQQHIRTWQNGCGAEICEGARKCISRGTVPCKVVFLGEAPGESENVLGVPFIGPAGHLLDYVIRQAIPHTVEPSTVSGAAPRYRSTIPYALTNLVCCIPRDPEQGNKAAEPTDEDVRACAPRLQEFVRIASPRLVIAVGALARDWIDPKWKHHTELLDVNGYRIPSVDITHPAAILRANIAQKGYLIQRCIATIENAVEEYVK